MKKVFITGTAGFIGFHLAGLLLDNGFTVAGFDGITDYYDTNLKRQRHRILSRNSRFSCTESMLENFLALEGAIAAFCPDVIVHLAAQAGVRYSIDNPRAYLESNLVGTFNVMECARKAGVSHLMMASTSSVYGANDQMPFLETEKTETPLTFYAATKKANEMMAHSFAHIYGLPTTMFRFFTVYGPWGRPDMALFKFTKGIIEGTPIDVYNNGNMWRDFTYVEDLVRGISLLAEVPPLPVATRGQVITGDSLSPVAPFRVVNIGNSQRVLLADFISAIEKEVGGVAIRNNLPMQIGDVPATWADSSLLQRLTGYKPATSIGTGVAEFVRWYREFYNV